MKKETDKKRVLGENALCERSCEPTILWGVSSLDPLSPCLNLKTLVTLDFLRLTNFIIYLPLICQLISLKMYDILQFFSQFIITSFLVFKIFVNLAFSKTLKEHYVHLYLSFYKAETPD